MADGGARRKDNSPSSFSTAEKTKEPSGFCVAKSSPCRRVGLRQVTDHGRRFKSGLRIFRRTIGALSSRRIARLPIIKCVEETLSRRLRLGDLTLRCLAGQSNARRTKERGGRARAGAHGLSRRDHRPAGLLALRGRNSAVGNGTGCLAICHDRHCLTGQRIASAFGGGSARSARSA